MVVTSDVISSYLKGGLSDTEMLWMDKWVGAQGEGWLDNYIRENWQNAQPVDNVEATQLFEKVRAAIAKDEEKLVAPVDLTQVRRMNRRAWISWVAAASVLICVGLFLQQKKMPAASSETVWQYVRNDSSGISKKILLSDSTLVILNAHSSIAFTNHFNDNERQVTLVGEAYFDVSHNPAKPFVVKAGSITTKVYGTAFNIEAYPTGSQLRVALKRGKIGVRSDADTAVENILKPGELLLFKKEQRMPSLEAVKIEDIGSWTEGHVYFFKTPLADVLKRLENLYGISFVCEKGLKNATITASFEHAQLPQILQHLSFVWGIQFKQNNAHIYVK
jgi:transmembrane sensor